MLIKSQVSSTRAKMENEEFMQFNVDIYLYDAIEHYTIYWNGFYIIDILVKVNKRVKKKNDENIESFVKIEMKPQGPHHAKY